MAATTETLQKYLQNYMQRPDYGVLGSGIGALGTLINGNSAYDSLGSNVSSLQAQQEALAQQQAQMPTLASMYGPNSPYAQQLSQTLARQDAKAGRNSQYGPRSVELQARLAEKGSQYAAQQAQSAQAYQQAITATQAARAQAQMQQQQIRAQQLASLFDFGDKTGMLKPINNGINNGLKSMFNKVQDYFGGGQNTPDYGIGNLPNSGQVQGFDMNYSNPENPYSIQTGNGPGFGAGPSNALMPQWSTPSYDAPQGTGGDPWAFLDNQ